MKVAKNLPPLENSSDFRLWEEAIVNVCHDIKASTGNQSVHNKVFEHHNQANAAPHNDDQQSHRFAMMLMKMSSGDVARTILANEGPLGFFKGLRATCISIAPYSALNFCAFDLFKKALPEEIRNEAQGIATASLMATALATGSMYPLDTIRRQMQLQGSTYANMLDAGRGIVAANGVGGLFRGFIPNAMKNMPNKSETRSSQTCKIVFPC